MKHMRLLLQIDILCAADASADLATGSGSGACFARYVGMLLPFMYSMTMAR